MFRFQRLFSIVTRTCQKTSGRRSLIISIGTLSKCRKFDYSSIVFEPV